MNKRFALGAVLAALVPSTAHAQQVVPVRGNVPLVKSGLNAAVKSNIDAVANRYGTRVGFGEIFDQAVQETRELDLMPYDVTGFRWEKENEGETDWYPQGITGSADAYPNELAGTRKVLITSWHHDPAPEYARITLHDTTDGNAGADYRHVLLVLPTGGSNIQLAQTHAGGLAWIGNHLYVASTDRLRVFKLSDIIKVKPARQGDVLTYDYILPQSGEYAAPGNPNFRFSSVSVDRSGARPALVTSEFKLNQDKGRIIRYPLNDNGLMGASVSPLAAWRAVGVQNIQGALIRNGRVALSTSYSDTPSRLYAGAPGETLRVTQLPRNGMEDLFLVPSNNRLYTLTEFSKTRRVFALDAASVGL